MQTQAELIAQAVANAAEGITEFNTKMETLFPVYISRAYAQKIIGGDNVGIEFANVSSRDECPSKILMNASGYMRFMMHLNGNSQHTVAESFDIEILISPWKLVAKGLKFRKIKGKTPTEALRKLVVWFEKNQDIIKAG